MATYFASPFTLLWHYAIVQRSWVVFSGVWKEENSWELSGQGQRFFLDSRWKKKAHWDEVLDWQLLRCDTTDGTRSKDSKRSRAISYIPSGAGSPSGSDGCTTRGGAKVLRHHCRPSQWGDLLGVSLHTRKMLPVLSLSFFSLKTQS